LVVGFYQNNCLKATPYRDFRIRKDNMTDVIAVNFISLAVEEKLCDPKNKNVHLLKPSCKFTFCTKKSPNHRLLQFGSGTASPKKGWVLAVTRGSTSPVNF